MKKVKITVLETNYNEPLVKAYGVSGLTKCSVHTVGQVFYTDIRKPIGFCDEAWKCMQHFVFSLAHGTKSKFFDGMEPWIDKNNIAIISCNDGLRPVVFKVEGLDEDYID